MEPHPAQNLPRQVRIKIHKLEEQIKTAEWEMLHLPPPMNTSKNTSSYRTILLKTNWKQEERLFDNQGYKERAPGS